MGDETGGASMSLRPPAIRALQNPHFMTECSLVGESAEIEQAESKRAPLPVKLEAADGRRSGSNQSATSMKRPSSRRHIVYQGRERGHL